MGGKCAREERKREGNMDKATTGKERHRNVMKNDQTRERIQGRQNERAGTNGKVTTDRHNGWIR